MSPYDAIPSRLIDTVDEHLATRALLDSDTLPIDTSVALVWQVPAVGAMNEYLACLDSDEQPWVAPLVAAIDRAFAGAMTELAGDGVPVAGSRRAAQLTATLTGLAERVAGLEDVPGDEARAQAAAELIALAERCAAAAQSHLPIEPSARRRTAAD